MQEYGPALNSVPPAVSEFAGGEVPGAEVLVGFAVRVATGIMLVDMTTVVEAALVCDSVSSSCLRR